MRLRISSVDNCDLKLNQILNKIQCLQLSGFQKKKKDYHVQKSRLREKHNTQFRSRWVGRGMSELVLTLLELMEIHGASRPCALGRGGVCWPSIFSCLSRNCLLVIDCGASGTTFPHGQLHHRPAGGIPLKSKGVQWSFGMPHSPCFHRPFHVRFNSSVQVWNVYNLKLPFWEFIFFSPNCSRDSLLPFQKPAFHIETQAARVCLMLRG